MTREEVVAVVGEGWVNAVESENCECDCIVTNDYTREQWSAVVLFNHGHYVDFGSDSYTGIKAVYYMDAELTNNCEDLGSLDWEIDHYELIG